MRRRAGFRAFLRVRPAAWPCPGSGPPRVASASRFPLRAGATGATRKAPTFRIVESRLANSELAADLFDLRTQLRLLQCKCDLLFREPARLHGMAFVSARTHHAEFLYF